MNNQSILSYFNGKLVKLMLLSIFIGLLLFLSLTIYTTHSGITKLGHQLELDLGNSQQSIKQSLDNNLNQITHSVSQAKQNTGKTISAFLESKLSSEINEIEKALRTAMLKSAEVLAETLSQVSIEPILSKNFSALMDNVKVANKDPNVIYAYYLRPNGKPYTRYINRKNPHVKKLLETGKGRSPLDKLLEASSHDSNIIKVHREVIFEGKTIAVIHVGLSIEDVNKKIQSMQTDFKQIISDSKTKTGQVLDQESQKMINSLQQGFNQVDQQNQSAIKDVISEISHSSNNTINTLSLLLIVMGFIFMLAFGLFFINKFSKPINKLRAAMDEISEGDGDLSLRLPVLSNDEVSQLAISFNSFVNKIEALVTQLSVESSNLSELVTYLSDAAKHTSTGVSKQQDETSNIANSINHLTEIVQQVAENTAKAAAEAEEADQQAEQGIVVVNNTVAQIQVLANSVEKAADVVQRVSDDTKNISTILDVIRGIAEQTNLLALNAAIEAARAGDQGRGFAVVADEVRTLAQRSHESTEEIQDMIDRLQEGVKEAVIVMTESQQRAADGVQEAEKTGETLDFIKTAIDHISSMNHQIANASQEQQTLAENVDIGIKHISEVANQTADDAVNTSIASDNLENVANDLLKLVAQFHMAENEKHHIQLAITSHLGWKRRLSQYLDGFGSMKEHEATDHHQCQFGQWYYADGLKDHSDIPEMKAVEQPHKELHDTIRSIVEYKQQGKLTEARQENEKIDQLSDSIVELMRKIEHQL